MSQLTFTQYETTATLPYQKKAYLVHLKDNDFMIVGGENLDGTESIKVGTIEEFDWHEVDDSDFSLDSQPLASVVNYFKHQS